MEWADKRHDRSSRFLTAGTVPGQSLTVILMRSIINPVKMLSLNDIPDAEHLSP